MKKITSVLLITAFLFAGCSVLNTEKKNKTKVKTELPRSLTAQEKQLIEAGNAFSYELFRKITADEGHKNVIISPLSISMALGMTLNGAAGETKAAMKETLGFADMELKEINHSYKSLIKLLVNLDPKVQMKIANSFWSTTGLPVRKDFIGRLNKYFNATARSLDFTDPGSAGIINKWVEQNTGGMIDKIVSKGSLSDIVALLINAIYFKGDWFYQFDKDETREQPFYLADGSTVEAEMMKQQAEINYYRSEEVIMAELPYGNSLYRMTVLLPANPDQTLAQFIQQSFTNSNMQKWLSKLQKTKSVKVAMPKYDLDYKIGLKAVLKAMGMGVAFTGEADFSNMSSAPLFISKVMHKTAITVDEEGTEAAAVTSVELGITSVGPHGPHIKLDRPFIFLIRENVSGTILFMGQVYNPAK